MAVTVGARIGVTRWSAEADPVDRAQMDASHAAIEANAAVDAQGTLAGRPAPGIRGRYYWATDDRGGRLYREDGATWTDLGPKPIDGPVSGGYTARITGHAAVLTSDPVLVVQGKAGQTGDLVRFNDPTGATTYVKVASDGSMSALAGATVRPVSTLGIGLVVDGLTSQAADLLSARVNGAVKVNITATGLLNAAAGMAVAGGPSGYSGGEIQGAGGVALSSTSTGSPAHLFDHRGAGNTGTWAWRNGTTAGSTRMALDAAGNLTVNGNATVGAGGAGGQGISIAGGSATSRIAYQDASLVYMGAMDVARPLVLRSRAADAVTVDNSAGQTLALFAAVTAIGALMNATVAGVQKFYVGPGGAIQNAGDAYLGSYGLAAGTGSRLHVTDDANYAYAYAEGASATVGMQFRTKGTGAFSAFVFANDAATPFAEVITSTANIANSESALRITWKDNVGNLSTNSSVKVGATGTGPGGTGRALYV